MTGSDSGSPAPCPQPQPLPRARAAGRAAGAQPDTLQGAQEPGAVCRSRYPALIAVATNQAAKVLATLP